MSNIAYLIPGTGLDDAERDRRNRVLNQLASPGTCIELVEVDQGPPSIESEADEQAAIPHLVELGRARRADYDAYIIGCYSDLGIQPLRRAAGIPVVGPVRASFSTAAAGFERFAILTINQAVIPILDRQVQRLGFAGRVSGIDGVGIGVLDIVRRPDEALERFAAHLARLDAPAVVPGCMSYAYLLAERGLGELGGVRIVNPLGASVAMAQAMVN